VRKPPLIHTHTYYVSIIEGTNWKPSDRSSRECWISSTWEVWVLGSTWAKWNSREETWANVLTGMFRDQVLQCGLTLDIMWDEIIRLEVGHAMPFKNTEQIWNFNLKNKEKSLQCHDQNGTLTRLLLIWPRPIGYRRKITLASWWKTSKSTQICINKENRNTISTIALSIF
jgi:hypothetical protein